MPATTCFAIHQVRSCQCDLDGCPSASHLQNELDCCSLIAACLLGSAHHMPHPSTLTLTNRTESTCEVRTSIPSAVPHERRMISLSSRSHSQLDFKSDDSLRQILHGAETYRLTVNGRRKYSAVAELAEVLKLFSLFLRHAFSLHIARVFARTSSALIRLLFFRRFLSVAVLKCFDLTIALLAIAVPQDVVPILTTVVCSACAPLSNATHI